MVIHQHVLASLSIESAMHRYCRFFDSLPRAGLMQSEVISPALLLAAG
jgi:hypothetical protein